MVHIVRDMGLNGLAASSSTTESVWLPLMIAILGLLSTLAGIVFTQLWNSRLETRRWQRELDRQHMVDVREDRNRTYDHRREAYVDFLRDLDRLRRAYTDVANPPKPPHETFDALWDLWTAVMVYGTSEAQSLMERCGDAFGMFQMKWRHDDVDDPILDEVMDSWNQLLSQIRKDLGVSELPPVET